MLDLGCCLSAKWTNEATLCLGQDSSALCGKSTFSIKIASVLESYTIQYWDSYKKNYENNVINLSSNSEN